MKRLSIALAAAGCVLAQSADRVSVPFSDPARSRSVKVSVLQGRLTVLAHAGKDVIVDIDGDRARSEIRGGMRRLNLAPGVTIEEENNLVEVRTSAIKAANLQIQVPAQTSLTLRGTNDCDIVVRGVDGDIDANCTNGSVTLENVSGSVIAHSLNGKVRVTMDRVDREKPMALSSLNGDVDLTLPAATKADLKMKSSNGDVFTDFEVTLGPTPSSAVERTREGGKYRVRIDRGIQGSINGGGPLISMTTLNGRIYLRKK